MKVSLKISLGFVMIACCSLLTTSAQAASLKLFVLAGQSNMVGYQSNINDLSGEWLEPQAGVLWYNKNNGWDILQVPTEPLPSTNWLPNTVGFGPEISLGRELVKQFNEPVALVKYAVNGTKLATDWNPYDPTSHYHSMLYYVNGAIAAFPAETVTLEIAGFFWMQGEGDASQLKFANSYESNLIHFIDQVRTDLNSPQLPFILGKVAELPSTHFDGRPRFPYDDIVRNAQGNVAKTVPYTSAVETISLSKHTDGVHFDSQGLIDLGILFAKELKTIPESSSWIALVLPLLTFPLLRSRQNK